MLRRVWGSEIPMTIISSFREKHYFLSNSFQSEIILDGKAYLTVEHAFQAAKIFDEDERKMLLQAASPRNAKQMGREVTLRADWEQVKLEIMFDLLKQKFSRADLYQRYWRLAIPN